MRQILIISLHSLRESFRKKFFYIMIICCCVVLCLSLLFSQLSLDDRGRLTIDFGLASIQILMLCFSVIFGSSILAKDLDQKRLWMILTRAIRPSVFFFGRYIGLASLITVLFIILSILLIGFFYVLNLPIQLVLFQALFGFLLESLLLLSFVFFFSSFAQMSLISFYCFSLFIIGHFLDSLFYFIKESQNFWQFILFSIFKLIPNLELINWKSQVVYQQAITFSEFFTSILYILIWIGLILSLSLFFMEKREYA